jgi:hypothetical protein
MVGETVFLLCRILEENLITYIDVDTFTGLKKLEVMLVFFPLSH